MAGLLTPFLIDCQLLNCLDLNLPSSKKSWLLKKSRTFVSILRTVIYVYSQPDI